MIAKICVISTNVLRRMSSEMMFLRSRRHGLVIIGIALMVLGIVYLSTSHYKIPSTLFYTEKEVLNEWPAYDMNLSYQNHNWFRAKCTPGAQFSIAELSPLLSIWEKQQDESCRRLFKQFNNMYTVESREGSVRLPQAFISKVKGWLGNKEELFQELYHQKIIHVINEYTRETTVFNPLRDKRPVVKPKESEEDYVTRITEEARKTCDFCRYKNFTAEHTFGRVDTKLSFSASNVFKLDKLHAVISMKEHHPIKWTYESFMDMMNLTLTWLKKGYKHEPNCIYPALIWDLLPKSGSSQLHPHIQVFLSPNRYQGMVETWRRAADDYYEDTFTNYFNNLLSVYSALGLAVRHNSAVALASLTPRKDNEVVVMAPAPNRDFFQLIYFVLRAFIDDMKKYAFSMGGGFPSMSSDAKLGRIPAFVRIITRGAITEIRTDMSALELFTATNVNIDPWRVAAAIQQSVTMRYTPSN